MAASALRTAGSILGPIDWASYVPPVATFASGEAAAATAGLGTGAGRPDMPIKAETVPAESASMELDSVPTFSDHASETNTAGAPVVLLPDRPKALAAGVTSEKNEAPPKPDGFSVPSFF